MNIVVLVKSAIDEAELRADSSGLPLLDGASTKISNFDKNGVEEAIKLKESQGNGTITILTLGGPDSKKAIREAMAMGATKGVHILTSRDDFIDVLGTSYCLARAIKGLGQVDVVFCSEGGSDTYQGQVGAMVAEFLALPFLAFAKKIEFEQAKVRCDQSLDGGVRRIEATLPAVISVMSGANTPRYPTLLQVMVAGKKQIEEIQVGSLLDTEFPKTGTELVDVKLDASSRRREMLEGTEQEVSEKLVAILRKEGVL